jgi:hypothetical protein
MDRDERFGSPQKARCQLYELGSAVWNKRLDCSLPAVYSTMHSAAAAMVKEKFLRVSI